MTITISGVSGTAQIGAAIGVGAESIVVALYADNGGTPGAFIAFLGAVNDSDVSDGLITLNVSIDLDAGRYWLALVGGTDTNLAWVQAANDDGLGVAGEYWVALGEDPVPNADGAYQFAILEQQIGVSGTGSAGGIELSSATISGVEASGEVGTGTAESIGEIIVSLYSDNDGVPGAFITILGTVSDDEITDTNVVSFNIEPLHLDGSTRYWIVVTGNAETRIAWVQAATDDGQGVASEYWVSLSTPISDYLLAEDGTYLLNEDGTYIGLQEVVPNALGPSYQFAILEERIDVFATGSVGSFAYEIDVPLADVEGVGQAGFVSFAGFFIAAATGVSGHGAVGQTRIKIDIQTYGVVGVGEAPSFPVIGTISGVSGSTSVAQAGSEIDALVQGASATGIPGQFAEQQTVAISGTETQGDAEELAASIDVAIDGVAGSTTATELSISIDATLQGAEAVGQCGSSASETDVAIDSAAATSEAAALTDALSIVIAGAEATSSIGQTTVSETIILTGAHGTGGVGQPTTSETSGVNATISGVAGQGSAGTLPGKKKRLRGGRGGATKFTPALFSVPEVSETDAEKVARYRKIVDDLLDLPPRDEDDEDVDKLPPRQDGDTGQPEPEEYVPDFTFLKSLEKGEGIEDLATTEAVPLDEWRALAEQEDRMLLGDVQSDDDLLLNLLDESEFYS